MKKVFLVLALVLTACATPTPYGKYGVTGGYTDNRIDANTFSISVVTNAFTTQQTTSMYALYRAAELTIKNEFDYFIIISGASDPTSMAMVMPGTPTTVVPMVFPNSSLIIKTFKGMKSSDQNNAYDAREVMKYLGPQIGVAPSK